MAHETLNGFCPRCGKNMTTTLLPGSCFGEHGIKGETINIEANMKFRCSDCDIIFTVNVKYPIKKEPEKVINRELGYYWVEWESKDNWLIFWFNGGYWQCSAMGRIDLDDKKILSVYEQRIIK